MYTDLNKRAACSRSLVSRLLTGVGPIGRDRVFGWDRFAHFDYFDAKGGRCSCSRRRLFDP